VHAQTVAGAAVSGAAGNTARAARSYWLIVTGLSGEPQYAETYRGWADRIASAARNRFNATEVTWLAEANTRGSDGTATRANVAAAVKQIGDNVGADDVVFVILIGHGSAGEGDARLALPGPDMTAAELATWLQGVHARTTVVHTGSASGAWLQPLAHSGRIVVTATKSGVEQNETTFAGYFADALTLEGADTDKDARVSVLEAYEYARREVERAYAADKRMLTEHAQIDGDGDGHAVASAAPASPDGVAGLVHFGSARAQTADGTAASSAQRSPALQKLYAEKDRLERELAGLRARKAGMQADAYQSQLETLLTAIAVNGQAIRKAEGQ
jgi:hypothetical protein